MEAVNTCKSDISFKRGANESALALKVVQDGILQRKRWQHH